MSIYARHVGPFVDLRAVGSVTKKKRRVGKYGLEPQYVGPVEQVVQHIVTRRKETLGASARPRVGATWRSNVQNLLRGKTSSQIVFTANQLCDLYDFAAQDKFWHAHVQDPHGLLKHAHKLWVMDEYVRWSIAAGKPEHHRPRNTTVQAPFRGQLVADTTGEPTGWGGEI